MCKCVKVHDRITGKFQPHGDDDENWEANEYMIKSRFYSTCDPSRLQEYLVTIIT